MAKRYKVKKGDTYLTIAQNTGTDVSALINANAGIAAPSAGFYINIPTTTSAGGVQPPNSGIPAPGWNRSMGTIGTAGIGTTTMPAPPAPPVWNPTGNAESASRNQTYGPTAPTDASIGVGVGGYPTVPSAPSGGQLGPTAYPIDSPEVTYVLNYIDNPAITLSVNQGVYATLASNGMTPEKMTELGFVQQPDGTWTRNGTNTTAQPKNTGGWQQSDDGSWHLNRNQAQLNKKKGRLQQKQGASQSSPINWSL